MEKEPRYYHCYKCKKDQIGIPAPFSLNQLPICPDCSKIIDNRRQAARKLPDIVQIDKKIIATFSAKSHKWGLNQFFDENGNQIQFPKTIQEARDILYLGVANLPEDKFKQTLYSNWILQKPFPFTIEKPKAMKTRMEPTEPRNPPPPKTFPMKNPLDILSWEGTSWTGICYLCGHSTTLNKGRPDRCLPCRYMLDRISETFRRSPQKNHPKIIAEIGKRINKVSKTNNSAISTGENLPDRFLQTAAMVVDKAKSDKPSYYQETSARKALEQAAPTLASELKELKETVRDHQRHIASLTIARETDDKRIKKLFVENRNMKELILINAG